METNLAQSLEITTDRAKYDDSVKELLADKQILARILKYTLDEFKSESIDDIINNIDEPEISKIRIEPGHTNTPYRIRKQSEEDNVPGEGKIFFDIRFSAYAGEEQIKVLINIEAQKSSDRNKLHYHLDNRILYYLGRMISSQKEVEFAKSDYDNLKAVRSIWICMDANDDEDSINRIQFVQDTIYGKDMSLDNIDKVQGVIIRLRRNEDLSVSKNELIAMLEELLKKEKLEDKKRKLAGEYGLKMNDDTERRLNTMCNISELVLEEGLQQGTMKTLIDLVKDDLLDIEIAAERANLTVEEFKALMEKE